jgi:hypothetical protein
MRRGTIRRAGRFGSDQAIRDSVRIGQRHEVAARDRLGLDAEAFPGDPPLERFREQPIVAAAPGSQPVYTQAK